MGATSQFMSYFDMGVDEAVSSFIQRVERILREEGLKVSQTRKGDLPIHRKPTD
jgi:hypothetical protein